MTSVVSLSRFTIKICLRGLRAGPHTGIIRGLNFRIYEVEGLCYLCSENKGADQLRSYFAAGLRLYFCIYAQSKFSQDMIQL